MENNEQYFSLISELIAKQAVILGPEIAIFKAKSVEGLVIDEKGKVIALNGDPYEIVQKLIDKYVELSGDIIKGALGSIFNKYPDVKKLGL